MKKVFSFFLAVIVFVSVAFCSFGSVAVSGTDADADYVKGLIISLSAVCGLDFPDWTTAAAFSNDFFDKIMTDQTDSQLNFLSAISELDYSDINNNFSSATVSPLILQAFEAALIDTYGFNIDSDLGNISSSIKLPKQFNFDIFESLNSSNTRFRISPIFDLQNISVGLNFICGSQDQLIGFYVYYDGVSIFFIFKIGSLYYFSFFDNGIDVSSLDVGSFCICVDFKRQTGLNASREVISIPFSDWDGSGFAYYFDNNGTSLLNTDSSITVNYMTYSIYFYNTSGNALGVYKNMDSVGFFGDTDILNVVSRSDNCDYISFEDFILSVSGLDYSVRSQVALEHLNGYMFSWQNVDFLSAGFENYKFPLYLSDVSGTSRILNSAIFKYICMSRALGYYDSGFGSTLYDEMFVFLDSDYLTKDNNLRNQMQSESVSVRIPYNIDNIIENEDDIEIFPVPDDIIDDGSDVGGTPEHGGTGGTFDPPDIPDLDDSTIGDYLSSFVESISRFFSWGLEFLSTIPQDISFPIFGGFISMVCIGVVALII